jgi:hypothetical protein
MRYTSEFKSNKSGIEMKLYIDKFASADENEGCIEVKGANITDGEPLEKRATEDMQAILTEVADLMNAICENGYTTFKVTHGQGFMPAAYAFVKIRGLENEDGSSFGVALAEAYNLLTKEVRLAD